MSALPRVAGADGWTNRVVLSTTVVKAFHHEEHEEHEEKHRKKSSWSFPSWFKRGTENQ
jgi:hypothetical protein